MQQNNSVVKRYIVTDLEEFEDNLARCLIIGGISYVQIENEFHFLDKIYRFYDSKSLKNMDICSNFEEGGLIKIISPLDILSIEEIMVNNRKADINSFIEELMEDSFDDRTSRSIPTYNKKMIKRQNKLVNQRIRNAK